MRAAVDAIDDRPGFLPGHELVSQKVMLEPLDKDRGHVFDVFGPAPDEVVLEHGDDLVVGFPAVDHLQPADDAGPDQNLVARDRALAEHADVEGVAVAATGPWRQFRDPSRA